MTGGLVWLSAGLLIVAGGLSWFGLGHFDGPRVALLVVGATLSLGVLALYFHPFYLVGVAISIAIVLALWVQFGHPAGPRQTTSSAT